MKKLYKYETHAHTSLCSGCGRSTPEEMVAAYAAAGYAGLCITDHFFLGNSCVDRTLPWDDFVRAYWDAYLRAKKFAEEFYPDLTVIFGIEHSIGGNPLGKYGGGRELLFYGIDLDFLRAHPNFHEQPVELIAGAVHKVGGFITLAHPFRAEPYIDPNAPLFNELCDGVEAYNAHNRPADANPKGMAFADAHPELVRMSGGDEHFAGGSGVGAAGMAFEYPVRTATEFIAALRRGDGRCIVDGEVEQ